MGGQLCQIPFQDSEVFEHEILFVPCDVNTLGLLNEVNTVAVTNLKQNIFSGISTTTTAFFG